MNRAAVGLAALAVLLQIAYPLVPSDALTVAVVVAFAIASTAAAAAARGIAFALALLLVAVGGGFAVEALGVATGFPFGRYAYAETLGPAVAGVPLVVPLAWLMMLYPAYAAAAVLRIGAVGAGWALMAWDLFLDPQLVAAGHWRWLDPAATLPGIPDVPARNFLAWFAVGTLFALLLLRAPQRRPRREFVAPCLYLWAYGSNLLAWLVFFDRATVAIVGGIGMGVVAVPLAWRLWRGA